MNGRSGQRIAPRQLEVLRTTLRRSVAMCVLGGIGEIKGKEKATGQEGAKRMHREAVKVLHMYGNVHTCKYICKCFCVCIYVYVHPHIPTHIHTHTYIKCICACDSCGDRAQIHFMIVYILFNLCLCTYSSLYICVHTLYAVTKKKYACIKTSTD